MQQKNNQLIMISQLTAAMTSSLKNRTGIRIQRKHSFITTAILFLSIVSLQAQTTKIVFDTYYKNKSIGIVTALKVHTDSNTVVDLHTKTDSKVLMLEVHVESEINIIYTSNTLRKGVAYRHSNRGSEDIQSTTVKTTESFYSIEREHKKQILTVNSIDFCVTDLYFNEPVGRTKVFSNMYRQFINITNEGAGKYKTILPDGKKATYTYVGGKLSTIEVDMPIGKVISKRRN